jgi:hypothetical protein
MVVKMVVRPIAKLSEELDQLCLATVLSGRRRAAIRTDTGHDAFMSPRCAGHVQIRFGVATQIGSGVAGKTARSGRGLPY